MQFHSNKCKYNISSILADVPHHHPFSISYGFWVGGVREGEQFLTNSHAYYWMSCILADLAPRIPYWLRLWGGGVGWKRGYNFLHSHIRILFTGSPYKEASALCEGASKHFHLKEA